MITQSNTELDLTYLIEIMIVSWEVLSFLSVQQRTVENLIGNNISGKGLGLAKSCVYVYIYIYDSYDK